MGLKLRYNLFCAVKHEDVYDSYRQFWIEQGYQFVAVNIVPLPERDFDTYALYRSDSCWTLLDWCGGWEWELRRQAQLYVSRALGCPGLLVFVFDGDYWGYELFNAGRVIDHFVQRPEEAGMWFPECDCRGNPELFVTRFQPWLQLKSKDLAAYFVQQPEDSIEYERLNVPAHRGDQFNRFDECAVLDFLRFLGLRIELRNYTNWSYVAPLAPVWRSFKIVGPVAG